MRTDILFLDDKEMSISEFNKLRLPITSESIVYKGLSAEINKYGVIFFTYEKKGTPQKQIFIPYKTINDVIHIYTKDKIFSPPKNYNELNISSFDSNLLSVDKNSTSIKVNITKVGVFNFSGYLTHVYKKIWAFHAFGSSDSITLFDNDLHEKDKFINASKKELFKHAKGTIFAIDHDGCSHSDFLEFIGFKKIQTFQNPNTSAKLNYYKLEYEDISE